MATLTQTASRIAAPSSTAGHFALQTPQSVPFEEQCSFAFARIYDNICLVQTDTLLSNPKTPLFMTPMDVAIFRREFGSMFRFSHRAIVPASDVQVLATIDVQNVLCEDDSGVVFLAREMTDQLLRWTAPRRTSTSPRHRKHY
ncbi:hypothetical protein DFH11DRAFT_1542785 [Phellopilus nigrolimitatus]|nr:hypothetical protein DFH11DRAFT_1542785 [Phellopilus nigrolimitatus]